MKTCMVSIVKHHVVIYAHTRKCMLVIDDTIKKH